MSATTQLIHHQQKVSQLLPLPHISFRFWQGKWVVIVFAGCHFPRSSLPRDSCCVSRAHNLKDQKVGRSWTLSATRWHDEKLRETGIHIVAVSTTPEPLPKTMKWHLLSMSSSYHTIGNKSSLIGSRNEKYGIPDLHLNQFQIRSWKNRFRPWRRNVSMRLLI